MTQQNGEDTGDFDALDAGTKVLIDKYVRATHASGKGNDEIDFWCRVVAQDAELVSKIRDGSIKVEGLREGMAARYWLLNDAERRAVLKTASEQVGALPDNGGVNQDNSTYSHNLVDACREIMDDPEKLDAAKASAAPQQQVG